MLNGLSFCGRLSDFGLLICATNLYCSDRNEVVVVRLNDGSNKFLLFSTNIAVTISNRSWMIPERKEKRREEPSNGIIGYLIILNVRNVKINSLFSDIPSDTNLY